MDKPIVLLVEDDPDSATDYEEAIETLIEVTVLAVPPPIDLLDLLVLVEQHQASAVILDEALQQRSDATYLGIDAFEYLKEAFPNLPVYILTNYPHSPELKRRGLPADNLWRKRDFDDLEDVKERNLHDLFQQIERYCEKSRQIQEPVAIPDTVTEGLVRDLARLHFETEDAIERIVWIKSDKEEIRLIEVNRTTLPTGSIQVFRFAPSEQMPFPILIADVTPTEWSQIESGSIPLPPHWDLDTAQVFGRAELL